MDLRYNSEPVLSVASVGIFRSVRLFTLSFEAFPLFSFRPLIQNKLEVLGKAGLSEEVLDADCTFFKVRM